MKDGKNIMQIIPLKNNYFRFMEHEGEQIDFKIELNSSGVAESITGPGKNGQMNTIKKLVE